MKKYIFFLVFLIGIGFNNPAFSQLEGGFEQELPSPTAMSFAQVVDIPVNLFTGQPNISVPLYSMTYHDLQIPINLTYSTTGLRVEDVSSYVGQGWNLNIGGVITRVTNGLPDESVFGYSNTGADNFDSFHDHATGEFYRFHHINSFVSEHGSTKDYEQDVFYYSFLGRSGKFLLGNDGNFHIESFDNLKINLTGSSHFEITIENGTKFVFSANEYSINNGDLDDFISSWFLTEIIKPNTIEKINFHYSSYNYSKNRNRPAYKYYQGATAGDRPTDDRNGVHTSYYLKVKLDSIVSKSEKVEIKYSQRLSGINEELQIDSIMVLSNSKEYIRYELNYASFTFRNYLDSIKKIVNSNETPFYKFEYHNRIDPNPLYKGVDHWGYYNGQGGNLYLTPFIIRNGIFYPGANRMVDKNNIIKGALNKIEYPSGGYDLLEFEPNLCQPTSLPIVSIQQPNELVLTTGTFSTNNSINEISFDINTGSRNAELVEIIFNYNLSDYSEEIYVELDNNRVGTLEPDDTPTQFPFTYSATYQSFNSIPSGTHSLEVDFGSGLNDGVINYTIKIYQSQTDRRLCSGLRIKSISSNDGINSELKTRNFKYVTADGVFPSGVSYGSMGYTYDYPPTFNRDSTTVRDPQYGYSFMAIEAYPVASAGQIGFSILTGYERVTVEYSDSSYTVHEFTTDLSNLTPTKFDANHFWVGPGYLSLGSGQYSIGSPTKISNYNSSNKLINSTELEYKDYESSLDPRVKQRFQQFKFIKYDDKLIRFAFYSNYVVWRHLKKKTVKVSNGSGQFLTSSVEYHYDDLDTKLLSYEEMTNSNGGKRIKRYAYAHEQYPGMEELNMLSQPYSVTIEDGSGTVLSKNWTLWKDWGSGVWRMCGTWAWDGTLQSGVPKAPVNCTQN